MHRRSIRTGQGHNMAYSFLGFGLGGVALVAVGCTGNDILLATAQAGASNGGGADIEQQDLGGSGGGAANGGSNDDPLPPSGGSAGSHSNAGSGFGGSASNGGDGGGDNAAGAPDSGDTGLLGPWKLTTDYPKTCTGNECTLQACVAN